MFMCYKKSFLKREILQNDFNIFQGLKIGLLKQYHFVQQNIH